MITNVIANSLPYPAKTGGAWRLAASSVSLPESVEEVANDFCYCGLSCDYTELAVADLSDATDYKNDRSAFLYRKVSASDTVVLSLLKNGQQVAVLNDNTLGTYYASFAQQPLYVGFLISWRAVLSAHGAGKYVVRAVQTILGTAYTTDSRTFRLLPFSDVLADGTTRLEAVQNGNIIQSEFDFTNLNWFTSYRLPAFFGEKTPILEADNYVTQDFQKVQIADKIRLEYTLYTKMLPAEIANAVAYNQMLANEIYVTDYNLLNHEFYRRVKVRPLSFSEVVFPAQNRGARFAIKFEPVSDGLRKRNY